MADSEIDRGTKGLGGANKRYSAFSLAKNAMSYHQNWQQAWRHAEPKAEYDAVILAAAAMGLPQPIIWHLSTI